MGVYVEITIFLIIVAYFGIRVWRYFLVENHDFFEEKEPVQKNETVSIRNYDSIGPCPKKAPSLFFTSVLMAISSFLTYQAHIPLHRLFNSNLSSSEISAFTNIQNAESLSNTTIVQQKKLGGAWWFELSCVTEDGATIRGWFNEFALKPQPAKDMTTVDAISEKLGLPTTEEQINYIKKLKKINSSLKTALEHP